MHYTSLPLILFVTIAMSFDSCWDAGQIVQLFGLCTCCGVSKLRNLEFALVNVQNTMSFSINEEINVAL